MKFIANTLFLAIVLLVFAGFIGTISGRRIEIDNEEEEKSREKREDDIEIGRQERIEEVKQADLRNIDFLNSKNNQPNSNILLLNRVKRQRQQQQQQRNPSRSNGNGRRGGGGGGGRRNRGNNKKQSRTGCYNCRSNKKNYQKRRAQNRKKSNHRG